MAFVIDLLICIALGVIVFQDFSYRAIHVLLLGAIFCGGLFLLKLQGETYMHFLKILVFVMIVALFVWLYLSVKHKALMNPLDQHIGLGDLLFFIAVSPLFSFHTYMIYFVSGMILTLVLSLVFRQYMTKKLVPLAGILAGYLTILKVVGFFYNDSIFFAIKNIPLKTLLT